MARAVCSRDAPRSPARSGSAAGRRRGSTAACRPARPARPGPARTAARSGTSMSDGQPGALHAAAGRTTPAASSTSHSSACAQSSVPTTASSTRGPAASMLGASARAVVTASSQVRNRSARRRRVTSCTAWTAPADRAVRPGDRLRVDQVVAGAPAPALQHQLLVAQPLAAQRPDQRRCPRASAPRRRRARRTAPRSPRCRQPGVAPQRCIRALTSTIRAVGVAGGDPVVQAVQHRVEEPALLVDLVPGQLLGDQQRADLRGLGDGGDLVGRPLPRLGSNAQQTPMTRRRRRGPDARGRRRRPPARSEPCGTRGSVARSSITSGPPVRDDDRRPGSPRAGCRRPRPVDGEPVAAVQAQPVAVDEVDQAGRGVRGPGQQRGELVGGPAGQHAAVQLPGRRIACRRPGVGRAARGAAWPRARRWGRRVCVGAGMASWGR